MSHFDDVIEPALTRNTRHIKSNRVRWLCKDGRQMYVDEMTDSHLENAIKAIRRRLNTQEERSDDPSTLQLLLNEQRGRK